MPDSRPIYQAYLLRLWRGDEGSPWRASIAPVGAEQQIHFSDVEELVAFLREQSGQIGHKRLISSSTRKDEAA